MPAKKKNTAKDSSGGDGVIYARYSSHAQREESIEQQIKKATIYAKTMGIRIQEIYADRAVSGRSDRRNDFQRMMRDAEKGKFKFVIAWKSNRMGRNMLQAMMNEAKLQDCGIRVLYVEEDFDDTAAGRFALRSMMNVNQFFSENMAEDIKRGLIDNAEKCMVTNGGLPFGYKKGLDLKYEIDEPKDTIVREIFVRVARGEAFVDIANDLNARGIRTSKGNPWGKGSFHRMLANERYTGVYIYDDIRIEGGVPQIVSEELFCKVQEVLKTKKNPQGRHRVNGDYLLTGKLFCGKCKAPMVGVSGTSRTNDVHFYYTCQKKRMEKACDKKNVRRDVVERAVAQAIKDHALQDDVINWIADSTVAYNHRQEEQSHLTILENELADSKQSIKNLMSAIEKGIVTESTKDRLIELEGEQARIKSKISAARADIIVVKKEDVVAGLEMFKDGDVENKKYQAKLFDTFLVAVYLYDNELKIVFSFSGKNNTINVPIDVGLVDNANEMEDGREGSYKFSSAPPSDRINSNVYAVFSFSVILNSNALSVTPPPANCSQATVSSISK